MILLSNLLGYQSLGAERSGLSLPIFFFRNGGLTDSEISFIVETPELRAGFRAGAVEFNKHGSQTTLEFAGANQLAHIEPELPLPGIVNFFHGADARTGIETYARLRYRDLYPGIDLTYSGTGRRLKAEFTVAPGADPSAIRMRYEAATVSITPAGELMVHGRQAELTEDTPVVFQAGRKIGGRYHLLSANTVGFEIDAYDRTQPLIIDPTITYSTYLGGSSMGAITGVAVDSSDNVYVTGWTEAPDFPIAGAYQAIDAGGVDAIVAKLNASGTSLIYATYIGGNSDDRAYAIAVDSSDNAYIAGSTASTNFPRVSSLRSSLGGSRDAFVVKLNSAGNTLLYSTLLGGSNNDWGYAIAVDTSGNAYIAGDTQSTDFPLASAEQAASGGNMDAFVTKLSPTSTLVFSTYLGGSGNEHAGGIAIDASHNVYVAGGTFSSNFPVISALQPANLGSQEAFVTKISAAGSPLVYSTYLGGSSGTVANPEQANAIAVDASGNAYVAGVTPSSNFPITAGALQTASGGGVDAFAAKINPAGNALVYSTFLGGYGFDQANGIAVDTSGNAYIAGYTASGNFPVANPVQASFAGNYDAFVSELNPSGNALIFSTFYGGSGSDEAFAIALDPNANIFIGGQTNSTNFPIVNAHQNVDSGGAVGFVARLGVTAPPSQYPSVVSVSPASGSGNMVTFTAQYSDPAGPSAFQSVALLVNSSASTNYACYITYSIASNTFALANDLAASGSSTVLPNGGSAQNNQCSLSGIGSSVSTAGNTLTMTVVLSFQASFAGSQKVYLWAQDSNTNTGWVAKGTWTVTVPPPQPSVVSVSPNSNSGGAQTFQFVFADTQNPTNIVATAMVFAPSLSSFNNTCYIVYDAVHATIQLEYDNMSGATVRSIASNTPLSNSHCTVGAAGVSYSALSLILTVSVTFNGKFSGAQNIFMYAAEGSGTPNTGWVNEGTYTVLAGGNPVANSVVPSTGSGPGQRFSVTVSDAGGSGFLQDIGVLIAPTLSYNNACLLVYDRVAGVIALSYDNPSHGSSEVAFGSNSTISNSQCSLNAATSTVVFGTNQVVLTLSIAFSATYSGPMNVYVQAYEASTSSGWQALGTWTVTGGTPSADSVTPSSGAGSNLINFTFSATDTVNGNNISSIGMLYTAGAPTNTANACYLLYNRTAATIGLYDNTGTILSTKPVGSSATLANSQCAVGFVQATPSGNSILLSIQLLFYPAFDGVKTVYENAMEPSGSSGWVQRGTWTVQ